ncbi:hypothetical protein [Actinoplanes sp. NPDC020271]|uniref:hypothetical protein n=1 Tax=Actinoplanes sp. NPDC020271 TaxID=3363896 RepID=UPI0037A93288
MTTLVLAGCGGSEEERAITTTSTGAASAGVTATTGPDRPVETPRAPDRSYSAQELERALLTVTDLPTGWSADPDGKPGHDSPEQFAECPKYAALVRKLNGMAEGATGFVSPTGSDVSENLRSLSQTGAAALFAEQTEAITACPRLTGTTDSGLSFTMSLTALSFPRLGDETFAFRGATTAYGTTVTADVVTVRRGGVLVGIAHTAKGPVDTAVTEDLIRRALDKAAKVLV